MRTANSGDGFLAASHASLRVGHGFFTTEIQAAAGAEFRNDTLDAALDCVDFELHRAMK